MIIGRNCSWHRPYKVVVNNKFYEVEKIHFYTGDGVLVSTNSGWLQSGEGSLNDVKSIELPIDKIYLKRKLKFDGNVFVILKRNTTFNETFAHLYIPADMLDIHFVEHKIQYGYQVRAIYEGANEIYISSYIKSLDGELNAISNEYEEVHKSVNDCALHIRNFDEVIAKIDKLKELAEAYNAERKRLNNLTINDIEI